MATGLPSQTQVIELLDAEFARAGYQIEDVVIDSGARPPRITVIADGDTALNSDTAARLSRAASALLDTVDGDAGGYLLEVSSPGVDRPLTTETHFRRARGRKIDVVVADGTRLTGRAGAITDGELTLVVAAGKNQWMARQLPIAQITHAVVQVEFAAPHRRELELAGLNAGDAGDTGTTGDSGDTDAETEEAGA